MAGALPRAVAPHGISMTTLIPGYPSVIQAFGAPVKSTAGIPCSARLRGSCRPSSMTILGWFLTHPAISSATAVLIPILPARTGSTIGGALRRSLEPRRILPAVPPKWVLSTFSTRMIGRPDWRQPISALRPSAAKMFRPS